MLVVFVVVAVVVVAVVVVAVFLLVLPVGFLVFVCAVPCKLPFSYLFPVSLFVYPYTTILLVSLRLLLLL